MQETSVNCTLSASPLDGLLGSLTSFQGRLQTLRDDMQILGNRLYGSYPVEGATQQPNTPTVEQPLLTRLNLQVLDLFAELTALEEAFQRIASL